MFWHGHAHAMIDFGRLDFYVGQKNVCCVFLLSPFRSAMQGGIYLFFRLEGSFILCGWGKSHASNEGVLLPMGDCAL